MILKIDKPISDKELRSLLNDNYDGIEIPKDKFDEIMNNLDPFSITYPILNSPARIYGLKVVII